MKGEILDIETVEELAENKKEIERLKRDKNLKELENKELIKKVAKQDMEIYYLKRVNKTFELTESYLKHRIKQISDKKDTRYDYAILELKKLSDALEFERKKIENKEVENEEI